MRALLIPLALAAVAGCAVPQGTSPAPEVAYAAAGPPLTACTPDAVAGIGSRAGQYPVRVCGEDDRLIAAYRLGRDLFLVEEELREVNYRVASADGRFGYGGLGIGSKGYLISRRVELKNARRAIRNEIARLEAGGALRGRVATRNPQAIQTP